MSQDDFYRGDPPPYGAPFHGSPSYGPPGYGPPGHGPGWRRPTNQLAIIALVATFLLAPVGLVLGLIARGQIRRTGEQGDGLALAAIVIGGLGTALMATGLVVWIGLLASISDGAFAP